MFLIGRSGNAGKILEASIVVAEHELLDLVRIQLSQLELHRSIGGSYDLKPNAAAM